MNRVNVRLVSKDLNLLQKPRVVGVAKDILNNIAEEPYLIKHIITDNEMCVYEYDIEIILESSE